VLLVVEGNQGKFSKLDLQLAAKCLEEGRGLVIAANKSDIMDEHGVSGKKYEDGVKEHIEEFMREYGEVPVVVSSGLQNRGIDRLLNTVITVHDAWSRRVETGALNSWLRDLLVTQPAPRVDGKVLNVKYITQVKSRPPTFALFTNLDELPIFFERFLKSNIQTAFNLQGVPVRFVVRKTKGVDIHRSRRMAAKGKKEVSARSAQSPTGLGSWHSVARGASVKKGLVGPNRDKKYMQRRVAGIVRHKRKSSAGKGTVDLKGLTTKKEATEKLSARTRAKSASSVGASDSAPRRPAAGRVVHPPVRRGRLKKTAGGLKRKAPREPLKKAAKKTVDKDRKGSSSKRNSKSSKVRGKQAGRRSRGGR
jgi:hypothetical protein